MMLSDGRRVLSVEEAGRLLGLGKSASYQAIARNEIPHIRIGRRIIVPLEALERLFKYGINGDHSIDDGS